MTLFKYFMYLFLTMESKDIKADMLKEQASLPLSFSAVMAPKYDGLSHCKLALVFAVLMDLLGVISLLLGVFAPLEIKGQDFGDLLVYSGALLVLFSLAGWVMWYSGNIEGLTSKIELGGVVGGAVDRLARNLSRRIRLPRTQSSPS